MGRWTHFDSYFCEGVGSTTKQFSTNHLRWRARTTIRRWTTTRVSPSLLRFLGKKASTIPISPKQGNQLCSKKKSEHVKVEAYYYINWMDPKSWVQMFLGAQQKCNKKTTSIFGGWFCRGEDLAFSLQGYNIYTFIKSAHAEESSFGPKKGVFLFWRGRGSTENSTETVIEDRCV